LYNNILNLNILILEVYVLLQALKNGYYGGFLKTKHTI